jgi:hypothetical protein
MSKPIPTLTNDGFITEPNNKMIKILAYFIASLASESTTYGSITSLSNIIAAHSTDDSNAIARSIEDGLAKLYSNYFDKAEVECDVTDKNGYINIKIHVDVVDNNITYNLEKVIRSTKSGDIIDYENELDRYYKLYIGEII